MKEIKDEGYEYYNDNGELGQQYTIVFENFREYAEAFISAARTGAEEAAKQGIKDAHIPKNIYEVARSLIRSYTLSISEPYPEGGDNSKKLEWRECQRKQGEFVYNFASECITEDNKCHDCPQEIREFLENWIKANPPIAKAEENQLYLTGFEPAKQRYKAPFFNNPQYTIIPTAALFRDLPILHYDVTGLAEVGVDRATKDKKHRHHVYMLMLDELSNKYPIEPIDKNILIALGNLYGERKKQPGGEGMQGGSIITAEDIIHRCRGLGGADDVSDALIATINNRIKYLMNLRVSFDFSQHFEYKKKELGAGEEIELEIPDNMRQINPHTGTIIRFSYKGKMIHANEIEVEYSSGRIANGYEILAAPIVFDYAMKIKQVATIETKLLDIRKKAKASFNNTTTADIMKIFLLEQINAMIDAKTHKPKPEKIYSHKIMLDKMFEKLRIEATTRKVKKQKVDIVKSILDHFKETEDKTRGHFINGYEILKGRRNLIIGFEILF